MPDAPSTPAREPLVGSAQAVVLEVLVHGPLSRSELAARLSLSGPSLTRITKPLIDSGLLVEAPSTGSAGLGRPAVPLDLDPGKHHFLGVKLTRDRLFAVVTDQRGAILREHDEELLGRGVASVVEQIAGAATRLAADDPRIRATGIALGGSTVDREHVRRAAFLDWTDVPLGRLVSDATGLPSWVENDVRALTQAEHWFGAGRGHRSFALVTVGAGIGLGLVGNDAIIAGAHSSAGSIGHQRLGRVDDAAGADTSADAAAAAADAPCELGHRGCARGALSEGAVLARARAALGHDVGFDELLGLAGAGDGEARRVVDGAASALGILLADVVNVFDPEVVLLSGECAALGTVGATALDDALRRATHWATPTPAIVVQPFRFTAWARGAAAVAIRQHALSR